jgi:hypothetical protein
VASREGLKRSLQLLIVRESEIAYEDYRRADIKFIYFNN